MIKENSDVDVTAKHEALNAAIAKCAQLSLEADRNLDVVNMEPKAIMDNFRKLITKTNELEVQAITHCSVEQKTPFDIVRFDPSPRIMEFFSGLGKLTTASCASQCIVMGLPLKRISSGKVGRKRSSQWSLMIG